MSPPPSPNGKVPARGGYVKVAVLLLVLLITTVIIGGLAFIYLSSPDGESPTIDVTPNKTQRRNRPSAHFQSSDVSPIVGRPIQKGIETTTTPTTTIQTTVSTTTRTTTTSTTGEHAEVVIEEEPTIEVIETTEKIEEKEEEEEEEEEEIVEEKGEIDRCAALPIVRSSCAVVKRLPISHSPTPLNLLHYSLNLTTSYGSHFIGDSEIFIRPSTQTNQIELGATQHLRSLDSVTVFDCTSGEAICSTVQHDPAKEILSISLSSPSSSLLRIIINRFHSISAHSLYSQIPAAFNRQLPSVIGTHFHSDSDAKQLFPIVLGSGVRSPLSLCLFHDDSDMVTSSFPSDRDASASARRAAVDGKRTTCFEKTKPIQQRDFAFLAHQKTESIFFNKTSSAATELEVVFSFAQGFSPSHHEWIHEETQKVLSSVSEWTSFPFPLSRLTLIDAPIPVSHPVSPLGFIVLKSGSLLGNPKVATMRQSLMRQIIGQWIGGVLSSEMCVEDALITYLQWRINDEIAFIANQENTTEKVRQSRPSSLDSKSKRGRPSSSSPSLLCPDRLPSIFHSIESLYGDGIMQRIVRRLFETRPFTHFTLNQLSQVVSEITGDQNAGSYLRDWFTVSSRPLFHGRKIREGMNLTQIAAPKKEVNLWRLPIEFDGRIVEVKPELNQLLPISTAPIDCLVIDPRRKNTAVVAYDVETYQCLIRCSFNALCSLSPSEIDSVISDFGLFFTANLIPVEQRQVANWKIVFSSLQSRGSLTGETKCCIDHSLRIAPSRECAWTVNDICKKIDLSSAILSSV
ncbi:hypothetical protein PFISCL1PPCAC_10567 [Pristionchus fissidentatus]|uniref:Peptidase n=1 Tax=Pristionchus fissidentatus TaxID=1538716 RepID=A0AAV5VKW5_9BILA|nr:hypothetical protein PFISCL1PPCAC_10567 [Pristionchus fissidentatus]